MTDDGRTDDGRTDGRRRTISNMTSSAVSSSMTAELKIHYSRYWHEMNKSEREPPTVLAYKIWNHSDLRFWRSRKYQFWPKMTQNIHQKYKIQNIDTKWTNLRENHPRYLHIKFEIILSCGFKEEVENVNFDQKWQKYSPKIENLRFWHEMNKLTKLAQSAE